MMRIPSGTGNAGGGGSGGDAGHRRDSSTAGAAAVGLHSVGEFVTHLGANDVLVGRGAPSNANLGNKRFRELVQSRKREYMATGKRQMKDRIAREIVDTIVYQRGGRFLRKIESLIEAEQIGVPEGLTAWTLVSEDVAVQKTKQALRDRDIQGGLDDDEYEGGGGDAADSSPLPPTTSSSAQRPQLVAAESRSRERERVGREASRSAAAAAPAPTSLSSSQSSTAPTQTGSSTRDGGVEPATVAAMASGRSALPPHVQAALAAHQQQAAAAAAAGGPSISGFLRNTRFGAGGGGSPPTAAEIQAALYSIQDARTAAALGQSLQVPLPPPPLPHAASSQLHPTLLLGGSDHLNLLLLQHQQQQQQQHPQPPMPAHALSALLAGRGLGTAGVSGLRAGSNIMASTGPSLGARHTTAAGAAQWGSALAAASGPGSTPVGTASFGHQLEGRLQASVGGGRHSFAARDLLLQEAAAASSSPSGGATAGSRAGAATSLSPLSSETKRQTSGGGTSRKKTTEAHGEAALRESLDRKSACDDPGIDTSGLLSLTQLEVNILFALCSHGLPIWTASKVDEIINGVAGGSKEKVALDPTSDDADESENDSDESDDEGSDQSDKPPKTKKIKRANQKSQKQSTAFAASRTDSAYQNLSWKGLADLIQTIQKERTRSTSSSEDSVKAGLAAATAATSSSITEGVLAEWVEQPQECAKRSLMLLEKLAQTAETGSIAGYPSKKASFDPWFWSEVCRWAGTLQIAGQQGRPIAYSAHNFVSDHPELNDHPAFVMEAYLDARSCREILLQTATVTRLRSVVVRQPNISLLSPSLQKQHASSQQQSLRSKVARAILDCENASKFWSRRPSWWGDDEDQVSHDVLLLETLCMKGFRGFDEAQQKKEQKEQKQKNKATAGKKNESPPDKEAQSTVSSLKRGAVQERIEQLLEFLHEYQATEDRRMILEEREKRFLAESGDGNGVEEEGHQDKRADKRAREASSTSSARKRKQPTGVPAKDK